MINIEYSQKRPEVIHLGYKIILSILALSMLLLYVLIEKFIKRKLCYGTFEFIFKLEPSPFLKELFELGIDLIVICLFAGHGIDPITDIVKQFIPNSYTSQVFDGLAGIFLVFTLAVLVLAILKGFVNRIRKSI